MFRAIALGGGGTRGGLHIGALSAIEKAKGDLNFSDGIYGTSVGAIVATAIAFNMTASQMRNMFDNDFHMSSVIPAVRLSTLAQFSSKKGAFSMDALENMIVSSFEKHGINLKGKLISDSPQKLFIVASNMTTQKPTILTGNVPILSAIKASCCLPLVFHPQIVFNQVYLDGGVYVRCLSDIVPVGCQVIHISSPPKPVFPTDIETMSVSEMMGRIYMGIRKRPVGPEVMWLQDESTGILDDLPASEKERLFNEGYSQASRFLAKRFPEEL
jgi:hypothetical protein